MNFLSSFCTALVVSILFWSCGSPSVTNEKNGFIVLSGNIQHLPDGPVHLQGNLDLLESESRAGKILLKLERNEPGFYTLMFPGTFAICYLAPGDSVQLTADFQDFTSSVSYTGIGAEANNYFAAKLRTVGQHKLADHELFKLEEAGFLARIEEEARQETHFLDNYPRKKQLGKTFVAGEQSNIQYEKYSKLINYEAAHRYYGGDPRFRASEQIAGMLGAVELNDAAHLISPAFNNFVFSHISNEAGRLYDSNPSYREAGTTGFLKAQLDGIQGMLTNEAVKNMIASKTILQHAELGSPHGIDKLLEEKDWIRLHPVVRAKLDQAFQAWAALDKGQIAPNFKGVDLEGNEIQLSDLKGKNVYVDVWATWCGPCLAEQPALEALEHKYRESDKIAFVGISIDENKEAWDAMVRRKNMKGVQVFTENAWESTICKDYLIKGIPRFILIDAQGKMIDVDAPRPSSREIQGILEEMAGA